MQFYDSKTVAEIAGTSRVTAQKWAAANITNFLGTGRRKVYIWTDDDIERYKHRNTQLGWKKGVPRKNIDVGNTKTENIDSTVENDNLE